MNLALIIDDYLPDSTRVGAKMFHELALELINLGHNVTVITPSTGQKEKLIKSRIDDVNVWRFRSGPIKDVNKFQRAINETLLSYNAWAAIKHEVAPEQFDGVIYYSPSIFFGQLVRKLKQKCRCTSYLILRDLFPQWVIDAGMIKKGSALDRYFRIFEKFNYNAADTIGLMSEKNLEVFESFNTQVFRTEILRNWSKLQPSSHLGKSKSIRAELGLEDKIIYFYGGNIGHAQDMANLMRLAKGMKTYKNAHFLFVGQGDEFDLVQRLAHQWELSNFTLLESVSQERFKEILTEIDIGLFSLSAKHTAHNFPGKLLGYMVESKPILGSVNSNNDLLELVNENEAGCISVNGEDEELLNNAILLYKNASLRSQTGCNAYQLLQKEFSVCNIANQLTNRLQKHAIS